MWSESETHNFKKTFLDEVRCYSQNNEGEKLFDEMLEKVRNLDFSEIHNEKEAIFQIFEKFEMPLEHAAFLKDNFVNDPALLPEEHCKNGLRLCKEFCRKH